MPEQEKRVKTIEGLKELRSHFRAMAGIASSKQGRANHIESAKIIDDSITMLEMQEPVEPILVNGSRYIYCGNCKRPLCNTSDDNIPAYCEECGRKVNWE